MIESLNSFGIIMLIENTAILLFILDLARRVSAKLRFIRHPHLYWKSGMILLVYVLGAFVYNLSEAYTCYVNYLVNTNPIPIQTVAARVFGRTVMLATKFALWYYSVKGGFNLFKDK